MTSRSFTAESLLKGVQNETLSRQLSNASMPLT